MKTIEKYIEMRYNKRVNPWQMFFKVSECKDITKNRFLYRRESI
jgi:hypothetical protein